MKRLYPHPEYRWVDTAFGGAHRRNRLMTLEQLRRSYPTGQTDCYRSAFRYPDAFHRWWQEHRRSVLGYRGSVWADWLYVDLDSGDLRESLDGARQAVQMLRARFDLAPEHVWPYFSGSKGFHLLIPHQFFGWQPSDKLPGAFRVLVNLLLDDGRLPLDTAIYEPVRLLRLTNTRNSKSGLFKVPLTVAELLHSSLDEILALARRPRHDIPRPEPEAPNPALREAWQAALRQAEQQTGRGGGKNPKELAAQLQAGLAPGSRHPTLASIAGHLIARGVDPQLILELLLAVNATRCQPPKPREEIEQMVAGLLKGEGERHPQRLQKNAVRRLMERYRVSRLQAEAMMQEAS